MLVDSNHYIALCARRYAEATRQLLLAAGTDQRDKLNASLDYFKESAILVVRNGRITRHAAAIQPVL